MIGWEGGVDPMFCSSFDIWKTTVVTGQYTFIIHVLVHIGGAQNLDQSGCSISVCYRPCDEPLLGGTGVGAHLTPYLGIGEPPELP